MQSKWKKLTAGLSAALMLLLTACNKNSGAAESSIEIPPVTGSFTVTALAVEKADALVLQTANTVTVIDTGNKGNGKDIEKMLERQGIDKIDTLIITHFDKDHVGGAARLVNRMTIGEIYVPDYSTEILEYQDFKEKLDEKGITPTVLKAQEKRSWEADDVHYQMFAANQTNYGKDEENDFSICVYARHGEITYLFAGDAEDKRQTEIMQLGLGKVNYLKYPYHGRYLPSTEAFLKLFAPQVAVICCSDKEPADRYAIESLEKKGIEWYDTSSGPIAFISDGKTLKKTEAPGQKQKNSAADAS